MVPPKVGPIAVPFHVPVVTTPVLAVMTRPLYEVAPVTAPESERAAAFRVPVKVGEAVYATNPVPLSSVRIVAKLAEVSVPK